MKTQISSLVLVTALLAVIAACGKKEQTTSSQHALTTFAAVVETNAFPSVVRVLGANQSVLCTGTVISTRAVLTAAHCTLEEGTYTVTTSAGDFSTSDRIVFGKGDVHDPNDIAILYFSSDIVKSEDEVISIGNQVAVGDQLTMVGYGCNDFDTRSGTGTKRSGTNEVTSDLTFLEFYTPPVQPSSRSILGSADAAGSCFGDSGGPVLKADAQGKSVLVGVAHAAVADKKGQTSYSVDMTRKDNRDFIAKANQDHHLNIPGF